MKLIRSILIVSILLVSASVTFSQTASLKNGDNIPAFKVTSIDDQSIYTPETLKGKTYLIDFWATWCAPCIRALPELQKLYAQFKDKGFTIISLSMDQTPETVTAFRKKKFPMPWNHGFVNGGFESELAQSFNVTGLPAAFLVNKEGKIIAMNKEIEGERLSKLLEVQLKD